VGVEVVSTDKLEAHILEALYRLLDQVDANATSDVTKKDQSIIDDLHDELRTLQKNMRTDEKPPLNNDSVDDDNIMDNGMRSFASLIVAGVAKTLELNSDLADTLLQSSATTPNATSQDSNSKVALGRTFSQTRFNTSGWDGRSWQSSAGQTDARIKNSYVEFLDDTKDVLLDFLEDGIKDLLTKSMYDKVIDQVTTVSTFILGQEFVAFLSQTPLLLFLLGFTILFLLRRSQSNDANVPDDCACVWERIRRINEITGVVRPSDIIKTYRHQGNLHPRPYNLAPCEQASLRRISKCPFRYPDVQGNSCCKLAYESDDSFFGETRDYKILRTFYKLVNLGLLQTRIDLKPDEYILA